MELTHQRCPYPICGSSDAFAYNTILKVGKCHSCGEGYPSNRAMYDWAKEEYPTNGKHVDGDDYEVTENVSYTPKDIGPWEYVPYRGITQKTMEYFGVRTYKDRQEYIYPSGGVKVRKFPKDFTTHSGFKSDELFGMNLWNAGSQKVLTIVEGELDALSAFQMLQNGQWVNPVVSLPSATPSKRLWENCKDWIDSYEKIVVSTDNDEPGDRIASVISEVFPGKVYRVAHSKYKDANEFLQAKAEKEYKSAWFNAQRVTLENIFTTAQQLLDIYNKADDSAYLPTGIQALDDVILGLMKGHFTLFQAPEGIGKTEFMRYLEQNILRNHPEVPIAIWHMEETKKRSLLGLVSYYLNDNLTRKQLIQEKGKDDDVKSVIEAIGNGEKFYQFTIAIDDDPSEVVTRIRFLASACRVEYFFFEPIQDLAYTRQGGETTEAFLSGLVTKLSRLAAELNIAIVSIAHENDDGNIRDCRMLGKRASVVVKLERDKMSDDPKERNTTKLLVTKNRPTGATGKAGELVFNPDTFTLSEQIYHAPEVPQRKGLDF